MIQISLEYKDSRSYKNLPIFKALKNNFKEGNSDS